MEQIIDIQELFDFLKGLTANNDRDWFAQHKEQYDRLRKQWLSVVDILIERMTAIDPAFLGLTSDQAVYRIYRDVRFSHNKLPYKTHFAAIIAVGGRHSMRPCYYLHVEPGKCELAAGLWCPDAEIMKRVRSLIDAEAEEFTQIMSTLGKKSRCRFTGDSLKTAPKGYAKDHPMIQYIRMKQWLLELPVKDDFFTETDWVERAVHEFELMKPFNQFLDYVFE